MSRPLKLDLVLWLSEFVYEWKMRPQYGKGSNRSDLVKKFHCRLLRKYKVTRRVK